MAKKVKGSTKNLKKDLVAELFTFPKKMLIKSDGNVLLLQGIGENGGIYVYEKSITKKGMRVTLLKEQVVQMLKDKLFIEI